MKYKFRKDRPGMSASISNGLFFQQTPHIAILVAALGYFVDVFDLNMFGIVRVASLTALGLSGDEILNTGVYLLNMQLCGMLLGGVLWGILGDKRGRISVLFGSILLYSVANLFNGLVSNIPEYAICRFIAGIGLAGELGAGVTLVSEMLPTNKRSVGTTIIATIGLSGAVVACIVGTIFPWRVAYFIGGALGLLLLAARAAVHESGMFKTLKKLSVSRGDFSLLFTNKKRFIRYLSCIGIAVPYWFTLAIIVAFSPELGKALQMPEIPVAATTMTYWFVGCTFGDLVTGVASQIFQTRKKIVAVCLIFASVFTAIILHFHMTLSLFYMLAGILGFVYGYWAVFIVIAAEQFGTNLRATVATTVPNFVRGSAVPAALLFHYLHQYLGFAGAATIVGTICLTLAFLSLFFLRESFANDLNFLEES